MSGTARARTAALAVAVALVAAACQVPYDFGGAKGADIAWVVYGTTGGAPTRWYTTDSPDPLWELPYVEASTALPGDWNDDGRWEPAVVQEPGVVSSTGSVVAFVPTEPPGGWGVSPCGPTGVPLVGTWDGQRGTELGWFITTTATWQIEGRAPVTFGRPFVDRAQCDTTFAFDVPVPADYDGDGTTDLAVYEVDTGLWKVHGQPDPIADLGVGIGIPAPADYDGDGDDDPALWIQDTSTLHIAGGATWTAPMEAWSGRPIPADYDGDGDDDPAAWEQVWGTGESWTGRWHIAGRDPIDTAPQGYPVTSRASIEAYIIPLTFAARG